MKEWFNGSVKVLNLVCKSLCCYMILCCFLDRDVEFTPL